MVGRPSLQQFTNLFRFYENIGVLDPVNEKHLFALHYVYLPLIKRTLKQFMETWNSHPMRTCGNMSPLFRYGQKAFTDRNFLMWIYLGRLKLTNLMELTMKG